MFLVSLRLQNNFFIYFFKFTYQILKTFSSIVCHNNRLKTYFPSFHQPKYHGDYSKGIRKNINQNLETVGRDTTTKF